MLKSLKELKHQADARSEERHAARDEENRVIINMNVRDDSEFVSAFSDCSNPVISESVASFLSSRTEAVMPKERLTLKIYSDCIDEQEKVTYKKAIKEYYAESYSSNEREFRRNITVSLLLFLVGVLVLSLMLIFEKVGLSSIWTEVIDIVAWVFLWEAADLYFLENRLLKIKRYRYINLMDMKVEFFDSEKQNLPTK